MEKIKEPKNIDKQETSNRDGNNNIDNKNDEENKNSDLITYIENYTNEDYIDYLRSYKKLYEDSSKCIRSKKCSSNLEIHKDKIVLKQVKKGDVEISIPTYINITEKLEKIKEEMKKCDMEIRYLQGIINIDADKKILDKYKELREKFFELEKEENLYNNYLEKVNRDEYREEGKRELISKISEIKNNKRTLYYEIESLCKHKNSKTFNQEEYDNKIKEYLDNKELESLEKELKEIDIYSLLTDKLYTKTDRNKEMASVDFIIKSLNKTKTKKKLKIKKKKEEKKIESK